MKIHSRHHRSSCQDLRRSLHRRRILLQALANLAWFG